MNRRSLFIGAAASLFCAPAIVRATSLMAISVVPSGTETVFVERINLSNGAWFADKICDVDLATGRRGNFRYAMSWMADGVEVHDELPAFSEAYAA